MGPQSTNDTSSDTRVSRPFLIRVCTSVRDYAHAQHRARRHWFWVTRSTKSRASFPTRTHARILGGFFFLRPWADVTGHHENPPTYRQRVGQASALCTCHWVEVKWWHCPRTPSHVRRRRPSCFPDSKDRAPCDPRSFEFAWYVMAACDISHR